MHKLYKEMHMKARIDGSNRKIAQAHIVTVHLCPLCGQPTNIRNDAEKYFGDKDAEPVG